MTRHGLTVEQRFWEKVDKAGDCWEWLAARDRHGYGRFRADTGAVFAHRFSYALVAPLDPNQFVLHRCDNPSCVRPAHLRGGTALDNMRDMAAKRRAAGQCNAPRGVYGDNRSRTYYGKAVAS